MSRRSNYISAVIWGVIAIVLTGILILGLAGMRHGRNIVPHSFAARFMKSVFSDREDGPALNGRLFDVDETTGYDSRQVRGLDIALLNEQLVITGSTEDTEVKVSLVGNWGEYKPAVALNGSTLSIHTKKNRGHSFRIRGKVIVSMPQKEYADIEAEMVSGSIALSDISCAHITLTNVSGSIHLTRCTSNDVELENVSGSTHVDGTFDTVDSETVSGSTDLSGSFRKVSCESVSGGITLHSATPLSGKNSFEAVSGSIHIYLPSDADYTVHYETSSGSLNCSYDLHDGSDGTGGFGYRRNKKGSFSVNGGGNTIIDVETVSGSININ